MAVFKPKGMHCFGLLAAAASVVAITSCAVEVKRSASLHQQPLSIDRTNKIGILDSSVVYTSVRSDAEFKPPIGTVFGRSVGVAEADAIARMSAWLSDQSEQALGRGGFHSTIRLASGPDLAGRCVRTNLTDADIQSLLAPTCGDGTLSVVFCQYMNADIGKDAGTDWMVTPIGIAGVPKAGTSSVHLRAVVRECGSGKELWRGESFFRGSPDIQDQGFREFIADVYRNFSAGGSPR